MMEDDGLLTDPEKFTFTYRLRDDMYELYDEQQILYPTQSIIAQSLQLICAQVAGFPYFL